MTVTDKLPPEYSPSNVHCPQQCDEAVTAEWDRLRLSMDTHLRSLPEACRAEIAQALADFEVLLHHACSPQNPIHLPSWQTVEYHQFLKEKQRHYVSVDSHDIAFGRCQCGPDGEFCNPCRCNREGELKPV